MTLEELETRRRELRKEARAKLEAIKSSKSEKELRALEAQHSELMLQYDELADEIEEARAATDEARAARLARRPGVEPAEVRIGGWDQDEHSKAFAEWLRAPHSRNAQAELSKFETRSANTLTGAAGGFVVPELIAGPILSRARDANPLRGVVRVVDVSSGDVVFPLSNANASSGWAGETDARSDTTEPTLAGKIPTFGVCYSYVKLTEEMAQDAILDVGDWFTREAGAALGEAEMIAIISGDGSSKPSGLLNVAPEAGADGSRTADAFKFLAADGVGAVTADEMLDLVYDLRAAYRANGRWLMNSATAGAVRKLKTSDGAYLWADSLAQAQPNTFAGYPVTICEAMEDIGAENHPIALATLRLATSSPSGLALP